MQEVNVFDYFLTDEGIFYISTSDSHLEDTILGRPVYIEDSSGDRTFNRQNYSKTPRDASEVDGIETSHLSDTASNVARENLEELRRPFEREKKILENVDEKTTELYTRLNNAVEQDLGLIGSQLWGLNIAESDVDMVLRGESPEDIRNALNTVPSNTDLELMGDEVHQQKAEKYSDIYDIAKREAFNHVTTPRRRYKHPEIDSKISLIPVQEPGTADFNLPSRDERTQCIQEEGVVYDDSLSFTSPRIYGVETESHGDVQVMTDRWIYAGSYEEGDEVEIEGTYFKDSNTIALNEPGHDISPIDL